MVKNSICLVAIVKEEEPFLDEWILYHRMIGIDYFIIYDDDPSLPLQHFLRPYFQYLKVVNWYGQDRAVSGRMNQTKAYQDAANNHIKDFDWVAFIDADEFIVLRSHENLNDYLREFDGYTSISLNWHVFGHNGHYEDPKGLITSCLTRRMYLPSKNVKSITRTNAILEINSPHFCILTNGHRVDANKKNFTKELYDGITAVAHVNHYQCRSFMNWMNRAKRGDVNFNANNCPDQHRWRLTEESCLRQFVTTVALNKNEYIDEYMIKFKSSLEGMIAAIQR